MYIKVYNKSFISQLWLWTDLFEIFSKRALTLQGPYLPVVYKAFHLEFQTTSHEQ